nr:bifunctional diguanylate cyclase/phosphodiesterase [uncultured Cellulosilyticum sp.]
MKTNIKRFINKYKKILDAIGITVIIMMYFILKVALIKVNGSGEAFISIFNGLVLDNTSVCGILTEMQIMLILCLTIWYGTKGYIISLILYGIAVGSQIFPLFLGGKIISVIGMIMMIGASIMSTVIYIYRTYLNYQKTKLHEVATYDGLTGVINRQTFLSELNKRIEKDKQINPPFIIVFIDIDDFKKVNDLTGHYQGDRLLQGIAKAWKDIIVPGDLLGRIGGDEFALIIPRRLSDDEIKAYIKKLQLALEKDIQLENCGHSVTASFGVSKYPSDSKSAYQLLKYADMAMYVAKSDGKNRLKFFSKEMYETMTRNVQLENALSQAIANNEFYLMYQPQYGCHKKSLRGFEVLLRWHSKELGTVSPAEFISIAEKTGLIVSIGEWVMETACSRFKKLIEAYGTHKILSINISALQLLEPNFIEMVKRILMKTGFDPHYLEVEITESIFISSKEYIISVLNELKEMGIHIALDDFGTNYASLSYIQMLPLDILKIDKSFIDHIIDENSKTNLVGAIISIAQELNYKVVAEGIEKQEQIQYLSEKGCDYVQGYLWGKPLMEIEVDQLLNTLV